MKRDELQSKRYIGLLRCSSAGQTDTSIDHQRRLLDAFARDHGMECVSYVSLEGESGSLPGNRSDIDQIIHRKQTQDDFEILLIQDTSRFTRAGIQHAHRLESELNAAGIAPGMPRWTSTPSTSRSTAINPARPTTVRVRHEISYPS